MREQKIEEERKTLIAETYTSKTNGNAPDPYMIMERRIQIRDAARAIHNSNSSIKEETAQVLTDERN